MELKAEAMVMLLQAKEHGSLQQTTRIFEGGMEEVSHTALRKNCPADTLVLNFQPPELQDYRLDCDVWLWKS